MAVDPKVVGGGAAVVAIGGGSGYAISQAVDSSKESNNNSSPSQPAPSNPQPDKDLTSTNRKETNKTALENAGFVITEDVSKGDCKAKLEEKNISTADDYKDVVNACVKNKKFSDKAEKLGLDVLKADNQSTWSPSWDSYKSSAQIAISSLSSKSGWDDAKSEVISFCTGTESSSGNKSIDNNTSEEDWKKFLKACTKDKSDKTVASTEGNNFWTNKPVSPAA